MVQRKRSKVAQEKKEWCTGRQRLVHAGREVRLHRKRRNGAQEDNDWYMQEEK